MLTIILCTGARACEALNGFVYYNDENKIIFQSPIEKKFRITGWKRPVGKRAFLGKDYLESFLDKPIWKSRIMANAFKLDVGWLNEEISEDAFHPEWMFKGVWYINMYRELKKVSKMKVKYSLDRHDLMEGIKLEYPVSFHWFRKAFCAQVIRTNMMSVTELARYIKWESLDMSMQYLKETDNARYNEYMKFRD